MIRAEVHRQLRIVRRNLQLTDLHTVVKAQLRADERELMGEIFAEPTLPTRAR